MSTICLWPIPTGGLISNGCCRRRRLLCIATASGFLQIDPWNRLEASREPRESETDYIGRCLRELYNFAVDLDCHVQILAHPAKAGDGYRRSDPPELEHIHGSKHWDNMVDQGFVVHRRRLFNDKGEREFYTELHHKKSRFEELGYATKFGLEFQSDTERLADCNLAKRTPAKQQQQAIMFDAANDGLRRLSAIRAMAHQGGRRH
ncbi:hypothetical protein [Bradyrhizobium ottawaense]|uniref:hypothetical protein n=2 Tax=Nitrobacteraceae TaxID=41294 RepID=UPI0015973FE3|nr:hypothetical protein [Bradyrhizobium sp. WBAH30]MDD1546347.1 hypothetical protein [Bradyrhizobium sp. WBAH41]MDD1560511.1 hypothetical protein [Bradyrhizobium sp. WBAH23]MDD1567354.1 hypothetical protein [Bradyrhizobium sp. WBAH33]MDD1594164.1 hypothetical protein [Bradyrhizobium sp. WBAH42]NRB90838.1 hypothetical protein [Bradyrhizobium sp. WBAH10]QCJ93527.1 hypothetical protein DAA57_37685 [Bradyrhizobium yuanmingense]